MKTRRTTIHRSRLNHSCKELTTQQQPASPLIQNTCPGYTSTSSRGFLLSLISNHTNPTESIDVLDTCNEVTRMPKSRVERMRQKETERLFRGGKRQPVCVLAWGRGSSQARPRQ
ncbi:hypothetical protein KPH14_005473 [Odynerus spinipes]|uniref:Uncharacterized protein n=1 Tax=Odynerus spinipes TaxID=1348599 RepID=A0AAD9RBU8_9HYME|nr:hypothetical protein KPH14_005473 [Odynerus spinipes]